MLAPYEFDRSWTFPVPRAEFWSAISNVGEFPNWWTWLREFDGSELANGASVRCGIRAPLAYWLRFRIDVERVVPESLVATRVSGDISGPARLEVSAGDSGSDSACSARLVWSLRVNERLLVAGTRMARPVLEWGHERIVGQGLRQFEARALG